MDQTLRQMERQASTKDIELSAYRSMDDSFWCRGLSKVASTENLWLKAGLMKIRFEELIISGKM